MPDSPAPMQAPPLKEPRRLSPEAIVLCVFAGLVMPVVCFGIASQSNPFEPEWQSGRAKDYAGFLLEPRLAVVFYPFMIYSMVCLGLTLSNLPRWGGRFVVRFGLFTGIFLALQYLIVVINGLGDAELSGGMLVPALLLFMGVPLGLFGIWVKVRNWLGWRPALLYLIAALVVPGILLGYFAARSGGGPLTMLGSVGGGAGILSLAGAAPWAVLVYVVMTAWTFREVPGEPSSRRINALLIGGWFGAYALAWWYSVVKMFQEYAQLPTSPPSRCYVSTAAARGHAWLVKSEPVRLSDGSVALINAQTRRLKCAELLLEAAFPRVHRICRLIYDFAGPRLAARLTHPLLADAAYISLKPFEWLARGAARLFARRGL